MPPRDSSQNNSHPDIAATENANGNVAASDTGGILAWATRVMAGTEVDLVSIADSEMPVFLGISDGDGADNQESTEVDLTPPEGYALLQDDDAADNGAGSGGSGGSGGDSNTIVDEQGYGFPSEDATAQVCETRDEANEESGVSEEEQYRREVQEAAIRLAKAAEQEDNDSNSDGFSDNADFGEFEEADSLPAAKAWNREKLSPEAVAKIKDAMAGVKLDNVPPWARNLMLVRSGAGLQLSQPH